MKIKTKKQLRDLIANTIKEAVGEDYKERQKATFSEFVEFTKQFGSFNINKETAEDKAKGAANMIMAVAAGKGNVERTLHFAKKAFGEDSATFKALQAGVAADGGVLITPDYVEGVIELLRPASVVRSMGPSIFPMPNGNLTLFSQASGASGGYVGETKKAGVNQQSFGSIHLSAKKQLQLVPVSNDLFSAISPASAAIIQRDLVQAVQQTSDRYFIRGDGNQYGPKGLRYLAKAGNVFDANGTIDIDTVTADIGALILKLRNANVPFLNPGFLMSPRTERFLMDLRLDLGTYAFREEMNTGKFWGYPYGVTTQIPDNLGAGSNESELYFVDFADVVIGDTVAMDIAASEETAFYDANNNIVSAFQNDLTVIRAKSEHDINVRHPESVAVLTAVKWGA